jgi:catechol 2,3-dioxygenase-like lactoylglutathione lyase family enzyme
MTSLCHHVAIQVADLDRAIAFYGDVLDGHILTAPRDVGPPQAGEVMGGPSNARFRACRLGFDAGCLELFQFVGTAADRPDWARRDGTARLPHFGVHVADVAQTLERVERRGGRRLWPQAEEWGTAKTMYAADPDGNVFELCDASLDDLVDLLRVIYRDEDDAHAGR